MSGPKFFKMSLIISISLPLLARNRESEGLLAWIGLPVQMFLLEVFYDGICLIPLV